LYDADKDGSISYREFAAAVNGKKQAAGIVTPMG